MEALRSVAVVAKRCQEGKYIPYTEKDPRLLTELLARVKVGRCGLLGTLRG